MQQTRGKKLIRIEWGPLGNALRERFRDYSRAHTVKPELFALEQQSLIGPDGGKRVEDRRGQHEVLDNLEPEHRYRVFDRADPVAKPVVGGVDKPQDLH